ncbi:serine acetyltransferase [bacterium]|nr:serine acetyltransferase [bacterium]
MSQFSFFIKDVKRIVGRNKYRILFIWISRSFSGILLYRFERGLFLIFGRLYTVIRIFLLPILNLMQWYSNIDIHYKADIKAGLLVLHPSLGVVISGKVRSGANLTLVGGNVIGITAKKTKEDFIIGDYCSLGANASIIGPLVLGSNVKIGAAACVVNSFPEGNCTLLGVPAKKLVNKK